MSQTFLRISATLLIGLTAALAQTGLDIPTLYRQAASGNPKAEYDLGQCYALGRGVPQDFSEAARWFHKAAEHGLEIAQSRFAGILLNGYGVTQNTADAILWYQKAAEQGDAFAAFALGDVYQRGGPLEVIQQPDGTNTDGPIPQSASIPKDAAKAALWYRVAANRGLPYAQNALGRLYALGEGVPQDYSEAYFWLSLAEAHGVTSSTNGVDDRDIAASHMTKSALLQVQERTRKWPADHAGKAATQ